jgi:multiple sugar transport system ATP-binding protein
VQQIGAPQFLYDNPANLFVAGFIGSPSMNFVPATLEGGQLKSPFGEFPLPDRLRRSAEASKAPREVIAGVRPEHFEDAALLEEQARRGGATFTATVEVLESMGSEKYAYFVLEGEAASSSELAELAADAGADDVPGGDGTQVVARLSAASGAREGAGVDLWFDPEKLQLFNPSDGRNLTAGA